MVQHLQRHQHKVIANLTLSLLCSEQGSWDVRFLEIFPVRRPNSEYSNRPRPATPGSEYTFKQLYKAKASMSRLKRPG